MKRYNQLIQILLIIFLTSLLMSCAANQEDTCERDKINGDWQEIVDNDACSSTEKAEAYLALGGFDYFEFVGKENPDLISILSLDASNWVGKKGYFDAAASLTSALINGTQKTLYLFGSYLALYTYFVGNLDNGADGSATAFDGDVESKETEYFTGSGLNEGSGTSATKLTTTSFYQFQINGSTQYYLVDSNDISDGSPYTVYQDNDGDGTNDATLSDPNSEAVVLSMASSGLSQLNQIVYMDSLEDPFANSGNLNIDAVNTFSNNAYGYLEHINSATSALGVDDSNSAVQEIVKFQSKLDNGGQCQSLQKDPSLLLVQYFATNLQETAITDYSAVNLLLASKLTEYGADATFDADNLSGTYGISNLGIKIRFLNSTGTGYIPNWSDATSDIKGTMEVFKNFDSNEIAVDGKVVFAEIICASELFSDD